MSEQLSDAARQVGPAEPMAFDPADRMIIAARTASGGGGGGGATNQFKILDVSIIGEARINVGFGTVNSMAPSNIETDLGLTEGVGTYNVYIACVLDADYVIQSAVIVGTKDNLPENNGGLSPCVLIGEVDVNASNEITEIRQAISSSFTLSTDRVLHPFQVFATVVEQEDPTPDDLFGWVRYGTVNNIAPSGIEGNLTLTDDAINYICLALDLDDQGTVTDATVSVESSLPSDTDNVAYILLGTIIMASGAIEAVGQAVTHSLRFRACDRIVESEVLTDPGTYHFWGV